MTLNAHFYTFYCTAVLLKYTNQHFTIQPIMLLPSTPLKKEDKSMYQMVYCNSTWKFIFQARILGRTNINMQKGAKCILELSWRYYKEEISLRCHEYVIYISLFKKLTIHVAYMSSEIWAISFYHWWEWRTSRSTQW